MQDMRITADGFYALPAGKLATLVTHLEMRTAPEAPGPAPAEATLVRFRKDETQRYRTLFRQVGEPWLWTSRLLMSEAELAAILAATSTAAFRVVVEGAEAGLLEVALDDAPRSAELAFLGLKPGFTGKGLGSWLVRKAAALAFDAGAARLTVHTCHLDDPRALGFYRHMGFRAVRLEVEVLDDPRATGLYPKEAARHIPFISP
jgi:ribosomal protein S18 acetylase RimI-like enzyme